jgi:hypothetical protein
MQSNRARAGVFLATVGLLCGAAGCPQGGGGGGSTGDVEGDAAKAKAASDTLDQAITAGTSTTEALNSLVQTLKADPRVVAASADEDGQTAWAFFQSGVECMYEVIDEEQELSDVQSQSAAQARAQDFAASAHSPPGAGPGVDAARATVAQLGSLLTYEMPGSNKAVLANSLTETMRLQDARTPVETMLKACGYDVAPPVDADLEFFKNLSTYGVIFIEAHGGVRKPVEETFDSAIETWYRVLEQDKPYCGLKGAEVVLQSSTAITPDLTKQYKDDLECGRLKLRYPQVRRKGGKVDKYAFYAVTPNFVRKHDTGTFPEYALLCINACRSFDADGSAWADLMYEKSYGSVVIGWDYRVHYGIASKGILHLLQLAAGTNEQYALIQTDDAGGPKTVYPLLLKHEDAPVLPQTIGDALSAVQSKGTGYAYDPWKGARLTGSGDTLYSSPRLMLAPAIETFETLGDGKVQLTGRCEDNAELRFADGGIFDIGTLSNGVWTFSVPAGYNGPMSLHQENRYCPPRDLLFWNPVVVTIQPESTSTAMGTCDFMVTYRLTARAVASGNRFGILVWDKPDYAFDAAWDPDGSVVTWSITGDASVSDLFGTSQCTWTGGNSRAFNEVSISPGDTGGLTSYDGKTAYLSIDPPFDLDYTATCSGASPPTYACGIYDSVDVQVQLGSDWSILAGSTTDFFGNRIEWKACTPKPAFVSSRLPR